ncbi:aldo/keto reductase [Coprinopsis sp. MPI-PUGE-AT-0042]|nr:aldo/keto reductase [Coprinopsis sp. MPI-PUGE-AT-0042]
MSNQPVSTTKLGGTPIGAVSHGLMMMTWTGSPPPEEQCFEAIKAGVDALPPGVKGMINSGEFYAQDFGTGNLKLLSRFFEKYPDYADKTFLSVKGAMDWSGMPPTANCSPEFLRKSVDNVIEALGPHKKLDLFEPARIDKNVSVEDMMKSLAALVKEGKFNHIGLSECSAATLRKAHAVHPVSAVEIEISLWSYEQQTKDVIATAKELGITVVAYSPLGRGFLTGQIDPNAAEPLKDGDPRSHMERFNIEVMKKNKVIVDGLTKIANKKGISTAQLSIAWVRNLGDHVVPLPGSSKATRVLENLAAGNIKLSEEELHEINELIKDHDFGHRYYGSDEQAGLWG